jgi:hypothetical protein
MGTGAATINARNRKSGAGKAEIHPVEKVLNALVKRAALFSSFFYGSS